MRRAVKKREQHPGEALRSLECSPDGSPLTTSLPVRASFSGDKPTVWELCWCVRSCSDLGVRAARREDERCRPPVWAGQRQRRTATPLVQQSQLDNGSRRVMSLPRQHQRRCSKCSKQAGGGPSLSRRDSQLSESKVNRTETKLWGWGGCILQLDFTLTINGGAPTAPRSHWIAVIQLLSVGQVFFHYNS